MTKQTRTVGPIILPVDAEYPHCALMPHALFRNANDLVVLVTKCDPLDGGWELPSVQTFARLHRPEAHSVIGGAANQEA